MKTKEIIRKYWVYILVLIIAVPFLTRSIKLTIENHQLAKSGQIITAIIGNEEWESSSYRNKDGYYYSFNVNGKVYAGHTFDQHNSPSDTIQVIYLKDRPNVNRPYDFIKRNYLK